jgi:DNA gyrase subunit A
VSGLLKALSKIDAVIETIRTAKDAASAKEAIGQVLVTTAEQTDAILRLQLGQLTRLNKGKLEEERKELEKSRKRLESLLTEDNVVYATMNEEFSELNEEFGVDRKTQILADIDGDINEVELIPNDRSVIVVTRGGYIKRMPLQTFESQRRGTRGKRGASAASTTGSAEDSADSEVAHFFTCSDHDTLLMVTHRGIAYGLRAYEIPVASRTAKGQPIPSVLPVNSDDSIT